MTLKEEPFCASTQDATYVPSISLRTRKLSFLQERQWNPHAAENARLINCSRTTFSRWFCRLPARALIPVRICSGRLRCVRIPETALKVSVLIPVLAIEVRHNGHGRLQGACSVQRNLRWRHAARHVGRRSAAGQRHGALFAFVDVTHVGRKGSPYISP